MTAAHSDKRRQAILAAASVFADKGYHGASTGDIAAMLGIRQASLYHYFPSKEDALAAVCLFGIESYVSRMETIAAAKQPFEAKLVSILTSHLSSYRERNEALKVHNDERLYLSAEKRRPLKAMGSRYRQLLERVIEGGVATGVLRADVDAHFVAQTLIGLCNGWGDLIVRDASIDPIDIAQRLHALLLSGLENDAAPQRASA
jgi:AcrR family transcriptional regulator